MDWKKIRGFITDFIYGAFGLVVMNVIMQFFVNQLVINQLGAAEGGLYLYVTAILTLLGTSIGCGASYARMVESNRHATSNGEYNLFLLAGGVAGMVVLLVGMLAQGIFAPGQYLLVCLLLFVTMLRYYGDVEFRLRVHYKGFLLYYLLISAGYLIGYWCYRFTHNWVLVLLPGELLAFLYVVIRGSIYTNPVWKRSVRWRSNCKTMVTLSVSEFLSNFVSYMDRILVPFIAGEEANTLYYIATLLGKTMALLTTPLNGVIIGHLARYKGTIRRRRYAQLTLLLLLAAALVSAASVLASHVVIGFLYPTLYDGVKRMFWVANASQVLFFVSNTQMVVVLRFGSEKYQLYMGVIYTVLFFFVAVPALYFWKLWGLAYSMLAVNGAKFLIITGMGWYHLTRYGTSGKNETKKKQAAASCHRNASCAK